MHIKFNAFLEDTFTWTNNKNGTYTAKSGYFWMLARMDPVIAPNSPPSWSWIWKLQLPEKIKFHFWLACHNSVPTLSLLNHRNISQSAVCTRCGFHPETFLHCVRDCIHSRDLWHQFGLNQPDFFTNDVIHDWLKSGSMKPNSFLFAATVWWAWRNRNMRCLGNENLTTNQLLFNIQGMVNTFEACYHMNTAGPTEDRYVKWNNDNYNCVILNVDGSCIGSPARTGYGGIFQNDAGF